MNRQLSIVCSVTVAFLLGVSACAAQLSVDATVPIRGRRVEPTGVHGGGVGKRLPIQVTLEFQGRSEEDKGKSLVDFVLTNTGSTDIKVPLSPSPGDLEPKTAQPNYTVTSLAVRITVYVDGKRISVGGADLYGTGRVPKSLASLAPGQSLRVHTAIGLPSLEKGSALVGYAGLSSEIVSTDDGRTSFDIQEIGYALSTAYPGSSLQP